MKKTLQEQYLLIKEGKGHKDVFIKEAKNLFPNSIRSGANFKETSDVLKRKQIIKENIVEIGSINQIPKSKKESYELAFEKFLIEERKKDYFEDEKAELKKVSKQVEEDLSHMYDYKDNKNINNVIFDQVMTGYYAEMKDPKNKDKTVDQLKSIVLKNLAKNPIYYTEKGQFGDLDLGYTVDAPGLGEPKEPKGPHKSSGYGTLSESVNENTMTDMYDLAKESNDIESFKNAWYDTYSRGEQDIDADTDEWLETIYKRANSEGHKASLEETQVRTVVKEIIRQELNENVQKRLQEIEKESQYEVLSTKADKIQQEIEMREARLTRLDEDEDMKDLLDSKKIKNLKKEIKILQKAANKVAKVLDKVNKKNAKSDEPKEDKKEEIVDEGETGDALSNIVDQSKEAGQSIEDEVISKLDKLEEDEESELSQYTMEAEEIMAETGDMDEALKTIPEEYKEDVKRHLEPRF